MFKVVAPNGIEGSVDNNWHVSNGTDTCVVHCFGFDHATNEESRKLAEQVAALLNLFDGLDFEKSFAEAALFAKKFMEKLGKVETLN